VTGATELIVQFPPPAKLPLVLTVITTFSQFSVPLHVQLMMRFVDWPLFNDDGADASN
jgi:hypothetical protein